VLSRLMYGARLSLLVGEVIAIPVSY